MKQIAYYQLILFSYFLVNSFFTPIVIADVAIEKAYKQASTEILGDLFITRELRKILHQRRKKHSNDSFIDTDTDSALEVNVDTQPMVLKMQGLVLRADGQHTVWLNNGNTFSGFSPEQGITVELDYISRQKFQIPVRVNGKKIIMKPGQIWNDRNTHITDQFNKKIK